MKKMIEDLFTTLGQARAWVRANMVEGCECPACSQRVKVYRLKINHQMAHFLLFLARKQGQGYYRDFILTYPQYMSKQYSLLKYWGLIEAIDDQAGYWRITPWGLDFIKGKITVPKYAYVYNDTKMGDSVKEDIWVDFKTAYKEPFDLAEIFDASGLIRQPNTNSHADT